MADDVVEIGPGGGDAGGRLVFQGPPADLWRADTASGISFSAGARRHALATPGRPTTGSASPGRSLRNLRDVDCEIPLGSLTVITGPSGAGKTTLATRCCWRPCASTGRSGARRSTRR